VVMAAYKPNMNNVELFIYLAEKGLSLVPHTPKRLSDQIGLFRSICWYCAYLNHESYWFTKTDQGLYLITGERHALVSCHKTTLIAPPSPLAKLRILYYFHPILKFSNQKWLIDHSLKQLLWDDVKRNARTNSRSLFPC